MVVLYHLDKTLSVRHFFPHAQACVDFFFMLSGFVLVIAYEPRLVAGRWSTQFLIERLIRLMPLILLGTLVGAISVILEHVGVTTGNRSLLLLLARGATLTPTLATDAVLYPLDPPAWSLFFELIISLAFGLFLFRASALVILGLTALSAALLVRVVVHDDGLRAGFSGGPYLLGGFARVSFAFLIGMVIARQRQRAALPGVRVAGAVLFVVFLAAMSVPDNRPWTWVYDLFCDFLLFPAIIVVGLRDAPRPSLVPIYDLLGKISYPIYILHWPMEVILRHYLGRSPGGALRSAVYAVIALAVTAAFAYASLKLYDEPVRRWLRGQLRLNQKKRNHST